MGALSSRVLRPPGRTRAQPEPGSGEGGSARRPETGGDAPGHGFCYCPGSRKRKRSSGALCYCHPESETDDEEEEGDEHQRLLNTPRRYVRGGTRPHLLGSSRGRAGGLTGRAALAGCNVSLTRHRWEPAGRQAGGERLGDAWGSGLQTTDAARML